MHTLMVSVAQAASAHSSAQKIALDITKTTSTEASARLVTTVRAMTRCNMRVAGGGGTWMEGGDYIECDDCECQHSLKMIDAVMLASFAPKCNVSAVSMHISKL